MQVKDAPAASSRAIIEQPAWDAARRLGEFTYASLEKETKIDTLRLRYLVRDWVKYGAVSTSKGVWGTHEFRVEPNAPEKAPRLRADGTVAPGSTKQDLMWRTIRMLKQVTPTDVAAHSNVSPDVSVDLQTAKEYCQMLARGSYLRVIRNAVPGKREAYYRLVRDTGPRAPVERRVRVIYDENLDAVTYTSKVPK